MKPRTKLQFDVIGKSRELHRENDSVLEWAKDSCLEHKGYATKNRVVCMECGETFAPDLVNRKRAICPHCGTKLTVEQSKRTTQNQTVYVGLAQIVWGYQIVRYFEIFSRHKAGRKAEYHSYEILQHWIREDGKHEVVARNHTVSWHVDSWNGDMEIRKDYFRYYNSANKYDIYTEHFHPDSVYKRQYRMYGINATLSGLTFLEAVRSIPESPRLETLLKAKQYWLLSHFHDNKRVPDYMWTAIKICIRNRYKVKDAKTWTDYIDLLRFFGKDLHNAKYVCPKKLKAEHDRLVIKKREVQRRRELEEQRAKLAEEQQVFARQKGKYLGLVFSNGKITVRPLQTVEEFLTEGDELGHCVYTNAYYRKPDSLIMSAMVDGTRTETVEISLSKMAVEQCRGKGNKATKYHTAILDLVNSNLDQIKRLGQRKKQVKMVEQLV